MRSFPFKVRINGRLKIIAASAGRQISELLKEHDIPLPTPCGGFGTCGKCGIRFLGEAPTACPEDRRQFGEKELNRGWRLACRHKTEHEAEIAISVPEDEALQIQTSGWRPASQSAGYPERTGYGAAIDIGTSSIAVSLLDLQSGRRIASAAAANPQRIYGADIISRATAAVQSGKSMNDMRRRLLETVNILLKQCHRNTHEINIAAAAGNAVMAHLFLGRPMERLISAPFEADFTEMQTLHAAESGLDIAQNGIVHLLPAIGSFIGGDISADLLVCREILPPDKRYLLIDLGTNCELALQGPEGSSASSAPAGPVMEGAGIKHGMLAQPGAVTDLFMDEKGIFIPHTIGDKTPRGICGSGLIHSIYTLRKAEMITADGRFESRPPHTDPERGFHIGGKVCLCPPDIRAFQMAKSAIESSWKLLLKDSGLTEDRLDHVVIAGAFGHYVRPEAGTALALFPGLDTDKFVYLGNGSLSGCELVLLQEDKLERVGSIASGCRHIEMGGRPDFQEEYVLNMGLGRDVY